MHYTGAADSLCGREEWGVRVVVWGTCMINMITYGSLSAAQLAALQPLLLSIQNFQSWATSAQMYWTMAAGSPSGPLLG
jgi:hypothetical protein